MEKHSSHLKDSQNVGLQKKLEESEAKYRNLFDSMDQGFCIIEMIFDVDNHPIDYRFLEINPTFEKQTGLKDVQGKTARELLPQLESHWFEIYGKVALTGEPTRFTEGSQVMERWFDVYAFSVGEKENRKVAILFTDITERYQAAAQNQRYLKQIEETKDQLAFAIEAADLATWEYNPLTHTFTGNHRLREWFGLQQASEIDLSLALAVISNQDRQRVIDAINKALQFSSGGLYDMEYTLVNPFTNEQRIVHAKGRAFFNKEKVAFRFNGILQDITLRKKSEQRLKESELRFRDMVEQAPVAIAVFRGENFVTELANEAYLPLVGKTKEEFIGKPLFEALPETRDVLEPLAKELVATGKSFPASEFEIVINRGGRPQTCYFNSVWEPYYERDGRINGFIVVAHEVTGQVLSRMKLEESEAHIRTLVESAPFPIGVYIGKERRIQLANRTMMQVWGKGYDVIGRRYDEILPELSNQGIFEQLDQVYTDGIAFHAKNQQVDLVVDGKLQPFYFNYSFTPLLDAQGRVYGVMNTAADVTDLALARKKSEESEKEAQRLAEELAASNEELSAANEEILATNEDIKAVNKQLLRTNADLDNFIYTASHDLKAPISNIESLLAALLRTLPGEILNSERAGRITTLMQDSVERFKRTIANLTEVVKLQKENSGDAVQVDLLGMVKEVLLDLDPMIKETSAQVEVDLSICPSVHFSEKNLRSVVYNLLSNALKYRSLERIPWVKISCGSISSYHVLTIRDNGLGMEAGRLSQLFTMFKRFHDHVEGTGIGLYMVKKMVENAGGKIEVESSLGVGSTFRVFLPY